MFVKPLFPNAITFGFQHVNFRHSQHMADRFLVTETILNNIQWEKTHQTKFSKKRRNIGIPQTLKKEQHESNSKNVFLFSNFVEEKT
jgi:hypothetical protein